MTKIDLVEKEHESEDEENESSSDESEDEKPRIKDALSHLSRAVSEKRDSELLHSMAVSKDILLWTPRGQLLRNKRIIPVTNISELVEYVLLPHNNDVTKSRELNTFLDGFAEVGVYKGLIKNKKLLSNLIQTEIFPVTGIIMRRVYRILKIRRRTWRWLLRMALKMTKRATTTLKTIVRKQKVVALKRPSPFTLKIPVNIVRTLKYTGHRSGDVLNAFGSITTRFVPYAITRSPRREITSKTAFFGVTIVEQLHTKARRRWKPIFIPLLKRRTKMMINFSFLSNRCVFDSFCH